MINIINILFLVFSTIFLTNSKADTCIKNDTCLCQLNENDKIDLSELSGDISPPYFLNSTFNKVTYTFTGCTDQSFSYLNHTVSGSLILTEEDGNTISIGNASQITFNKENNDYRITYVKNNVSDIQPTIVLLCDHYKVPFLKVISSDKVQPLLLLSSPKVCIQTEHHGMSTGSTFLLILFIGASIYFIGGALLLHFVRGARGAEIIPNVEFWTSLPGLVKDGLIFLLSGCKPNFVTTAETYDRI